MHTELQQLTDTQNAELNRFVAKIVNTIAVNKIICYGIRTYEARNWSAFPLCQQPDEPNGITVDLLIVPEKEEKRPNADILQMVEKMATPTLRCTCIVRALSAIDKSIADRHLFYSRLYSHGIFLHGSTEQEAGAEIFEPTAIDFLKQADRTWSYHFRRANRFHSTANWLLEGKYPEQALFYLHQTTEQIAMALMHPLTGYRPNSHNLSQLLALLEHLGLNVKRVFPPHDDDAKALFDLLKKSYIDSRYTEEYLVEMEPVEILYDKGQELLDMAEKLYKQQISAWIAETDFDPDSPADDSALSIPLHPGMQQAS